MPPAMLARLKSAAPAAEKAPLPPAVADWVEHSFPVKALGEAEWSADEVYLAAPRPGGDAWVAIDLATGEATREITSRGWISYLTDLHKGRTWGGACSLFIHIFAFAFLVFAVTSFFLLPLH